MYPLEGRRSTIRLMLGDCLEVMKDIPDGSVDMVLCDLPYGTTACKWDSVISFEALWEQYERVCTPDAAIVLFGSEPFSTKLRHSRLELFKYDWVWKKSRTVGFLNAKNAPIKNYEMVSVFSKGTTANCSERRMKYFPQGLVEVNKTRKSVKQNADTVVGSRPSRSKEYVAKFSGYPTAILEFSNEPKQLHPTQKPVALLEYLIKTYTNPGETVLDNCMGSGSTGVACVKTKRDFIGIELDDGYFKIAEQRIMETEPPIF